MKKICIFVGSRANYSSIKSVMHAVDQHPSLELQLILGASAILDRFGSVERLIQKDGFVPSARIYMLVEGDSPAIMAKSTGLGLLEIPSILERLNPDVVLVVGDRFETMSITLAAAYMNIPIAHTMGGEVSGTIDESIRHALTKFAHIHFPASEGARQRIISLGELPQHVHNVGCPRIDLVDHILKTNHTSLESQLFELGVGESFDMSLPFVLVSQHPVTTEYGSSEQQITLTLQSIRELDLPAIVLWPNSDAGSDDIARGMRKWRELSLASKMHFFKNLPVETYIHLMNTTSCLIGNSSSGIREGSFIGTPVVNIGTRQVARDRASNVLDVGYDKNQIKSAIIKQIANGRYSSESIYGNGRAGELIADILSRENVDIQKRITY